MMQTWRTSSIRQLPSGCGALRVVIVTDAFMGVDNVLAIAGASRDHLTW
jgi:predicted tellurium resistance membrane protein TerC